MNAIPGVIDFHVHVGQFDRLRDDIKGLLAKKSASRDFDLPALFSDPAGLVRYLTDSGVSGGVLLAEEGPGVNFHMTTDFVCDFRDAAQQEATNFFVAFGNINPHRTVDILAKYRQDVKRDIGGYKLYPADHAFHPITPELMEFYGALESDGKILMFHTGTTGQSDGVDKYGDPELFRPILDDFPGLTVVLAHAGKPLWCDTAAKMAADYENCYLDTAFISAEKLLGYLPRIADIADKVLFGSDWPVGVASMSGHIAALRDLPLPADALDKILYRNAARILGIE